jgi:hypothetical protein
MRLLALIAAIVASVASTQQQPLATSSGGGELSASVSATWTAHGPPPNGPWTLDLLVLWRGAPGWWQTTGIGLGMGGDMNAANQTRLITHSVPVATRRIELQFNPQTRVARLEGQLFAVGENNVLLIDDVDSATRLRIVGGLRVNPTLREPGQDVYALVGQSPVLVDFLRCDVPMADMNMLGMVSGLCAQIRHR